MNIDSNSEWVIKSTSIICGVEPVCTIYYHRVRHYYVFEYMYILFAVFGWSRNLVTTPQFRADIRASGFRYNSLIALIWPYDPYSPIPRYSSIVTAPLCNIWKQSDNYSWI